MHSADVVVRARLCACTLKSRLTMRARLCACTLQRRLTTTAVMVVFPP